MIARLLLPIALLALLLLGLGALWSLFGHGAGPAGERDVEAPGEALAPDLIPGELVEPGGRPPADPPGQSDLEGVRRAPAPPGRERRPIGGGSLLDQGPAPPEPGEYDGPLVTVRYDDGTPCFEAQQVPGPDGIWVVEGRWRAWHENGQLQEQGAYENRREIGDWQWWDENGERIAVGTFVDGEREGAWNFWYSNGVRQLDAHYSGGKGAGLWTLYFESGEKCAEGQYLDGEFHGYWTIWDEFGAVNPERSGYYENGQRVSD